MNDHGYWLMPHEPEKEERKIETVNSQIFGDIEDEDDPFDEEDEEIEEDEDDWLDEEFDEDDEE